MRVCRTAGCFAVFLRGVCHNLQAEWPWGDVGKYHTSRQKNSPKKNLFSAAVADEMRSQKTNV